MSEPPSGWQFKPGHFLPIRPLKWDEIIDKDNDDEYWVEPGAPSSGRCLPGDGNDNDAGKGEENTQGGENGTGKENGTNHLTWQGKATEDRKGQGKGKGKANGKGARIVKQIPHCDDISPAIGVQLYKDIYEANLVTEG